MSKSGFHSMQSIRLLTSTCFITLLTILPAQAQRPKTIKFSSFMIKQDKSFNFGSMSYYSTRLNRITIKTKFTILNNPNNFTFRLSKPQPRLRLDQKFLGYNKKIAFPFFVHRLQHQIFKQSQSSLFTKHSQTVGKWSRESYKNLDNVLRPFKVGKRNKTSSRLQHRDPDDTIGIWDTALDFVIIMAGASFTIKGIYDLAKGKWGEGVVNSVVGIITLWYAQKRITDRYLH